MIKNENVINPFERGFLKIAKINYQQEKPGRPIAKISSHKTQLKSPLRKNKLLQNFSAMYFEVYCLSRTRIWDFVLVSCK